MSAYQIEKGVPVPKTAGGRGRKWPLLDMVPGDSFVCALAERSKVTNAAGYATKCRGWKFVTRREGDSLRVWRVS